MKPSRTMAENPRYYVHPTSVVDDGAVIGDGTKIWHFCHVFPGAQIGRNCVVGQGCSIASTVVIGDRVKIQNGVSLYDGVVLEDEVFCGPHMIFTNVINPRAFVERKREYRPTRVCRGATLGAGAILVCGVTVDQYAMVGAGALVARDVPPFSLVYGNPARQHGWVGKSGTKLQFDADRRAADGDGARYLLVDNELQIESQP